MSSNSSIGSNSVRPSVNNKAQKHALLAILGAAALAWPAFGQSAKLTVGKPRANGAVFVKVERDGAEIGNYKVEGVLMTMNPSQKRNHIVAKLNGLAPFKDAKLKAEIVGGSTPPALVVKSTKKDNDKMKAGDVVKFDPGVTKEPDDSIKAARIDGAGIDVHGTFVGFDEGEYSMVNAGVVTNVGTYFVTLHGSDYIGYSASEMANLIYVELWPILSPISGLSMILNGDSINFTMDESLQIGAPVGVFFGSTDDVGRLVGSVTLVPTPGAATLFGLSAMCIARRRRC